MLASYGPPHVQLLGLIHLKQTLALHNKISSICIRGWLLVVKIKLLSKYRINRSLCKMGGLLYSAHVFQY